MAEIRYVDWDGLIYYDGKIKDYVDDKIRESLKFKGDVTYEELLQISPSYDNVNTAFRITEEFTTNDWFKNPGYGYSAYTVVFITQLEDGTFKYDILLEPNGSGNGTDLTNYYTKEEVDGIVSELPTKEFVEKTVIDAIDSVEIDVSGLVAREELELLETKEDAEAKLTAANKYTDDQISAIMGEGVEEAYNSFKELQELMKEDDGVTQTLLNDVSDIKTNIQTLATKEELAEVQQVAGENSVKLFQLDSDLVDINQRLDNIEAPDLSDYATKDEVASVEAKVDAIVIPEVPTKVSELENDAGYVKTEELNTLLQDEVYCIDVSGLVSGNGLTPENQEALNRIFDGNLSYPRKPAIVVYIKDTQLDLGWKIADKIYTYSESIRDNLTFRTTLTFTQSDNLLLLKECQYHFQRYNSSGTVGQWYLENSEIVASSTVATEQFVKDSIDAINIPETDLSNYYNKEEVDNLIPDVSGFTTLDEVANQGYLLAADIENKADKSELENVAHLDDLTSKLDVSVFEQEKNALATKEELNAVENAIPTNISQLNNDTTFATEQFVIDKIAEAELTGKDVDLTNYYTKSEVENLIPDVSNLVSRETLNTELDKKANDILFTDNYIVTTPFGGFVSNESVQNMTISQIITKLLGLTLYVPPTPDIELPDSSPEIAVEIVTNKAPVSVLDEDGNLVEVTNPDDFYRELGTEEAKLDNQEESFFYQIVDDNGEVVESGYQVSTIYQENDYLTVLIPNTITNFHVEEYSALAGDWSQPTWELVENPNYAVDGFTAYTVPEQYGVLSGIAIRIVINN